MEVKRWYARPKFIKWDDIVSFGDDAITVKSSKSMLTLEYFDNYHTLEIGQRKLKDLAIMTQEGQQLGRVVDVYFSKKMGKKILGYELSDGFISDIKYGRRWLPFPVQLTLGEDAMIVPNHCDGSLREIMNSTNE